MNSILKINRVVLKIVEAVAVALLCSIAVMIMLQILCRAVGVGLQWPEEMSRFAFVGVVFLGSALALGQNKHIVITTFLDKMSPRLLSIFQIFINLSIAVFCGMAVKGTLLTIQSAVGVHANSLDWFQYNYVYYTVLISCVLMVAEAALNIAIQCVKLASKKKEEPAL